MKKNDKLDIGFEGLKVKIIKKNKNFLKAKVISEGWFENSKGVHITNRFINLKCLTKKDLQAIKIGIKYKINNYALSFTNNVKDVKLFNNYYLNLQKYLRLNPQKL